MGSWWLFFGNLQPTRELFFFLLFFGLAESQINSIHLSHFRVYHVTKANKVKILAFFIFLHASFGFVCERSFLMHHLEKLFVIGVIWYVHYRPARLPLKSTDDSFWIQFDFSFICCPIRRSRSNEWNFRSICCITGYWWTPDCRFNEIIHSFHVNDCNTQNTIYWCNSIRNKWSN